MLRQAVIVLSFYAECFFSKRDYVNAMEMIIYIFRIRIRIFLQ